MARVLVIGSGLGGLLAAVKAADAGHEVVLATKAELAESNTRYAQGGIAAALFPDDSVDAHMLDTLRAGAGHCDVSAVRVLCTEGPARVRELIRFGARFDADDSGLVRGLEAAHSRARIVHANGDATGAEIERALVAAVRARAVAIHEHTMLVDLVQRVEEARSGRLETSVTGALFLDAGGRPFALDADAVILATGGSGQLFARTTNPAIATGDGIAAAWRAGAAVADLEFTQFHPTALAAPGTPLVSEAVRGEGAVLLNARGERFLAETEGAELAPRDVVARAVAAEMTAHGGAPVLLDATALGGAFLAGRFPGLDAAIRAAGFDWSREPVPVTPAAHYAMGGVATDLWGRTSVQGLFAVGEAARTGAHGANRLASNSLLEAAVFADRAVRALDSAASALPSVGDPAHATAPAPATAGAHPRIPDTPERPDAPSARTAERTDLQGLMWRHAGLLRSEPGLSAASVALAALRAPEPLDRRSAEDRNLLDLARLTVAAALARTESVGAHARIDEREAA